VSDNFESRDELTERLSALGQHPVSPALKSEHLTAMAGVARGASWRSMLASRVKLGAAVLGGFLIGTTGLASAGAMGPFQPIAKTTIEAGTPFEVPAGKGGNSEEAKKNKGQAKKAAVNAGPKPGKYWGPPCVAKYSMKNRGQYLQSAKAAGADAFKAARESDCGKGLNPDGTVSQDDDGLKDENEADDDGTKDQGKSADKRQDAKDKADDADEDKSEGRRGGKSGITKAPGTEDDVTPAEPVPAEGTPETPELPEEAENGNPSNSGSDNPGRRTNTQ